jgi:hypothetical protein
MATLGHGQTTANDAEAQRALSYSVQHGLGPRVSSCFASCDRSNTCGGTQGRLEGSLRVSYDNDGHVSSGPDVNSSGFAPGLSQCIMDAARHTSFPRGFGNGEITIPLRHVPEP